MDRSNSVIKQVPADVLRRENVKGRARAYDNRAAKALLEVLKRKRATESALTELGMEPNQPYQSWSSRSFNSTTPGG
jgi:hypothetical protein